MTRSAIKTSNAPAPVGPYSQDVTSGDLLFISGQIPLDPENGELAGTLFSEQCHQVLANLKNILHADKVQVWANLVNQNLHEHTLK